MIRRYIVKGHSMEPSFYEGDRLLVSSFFFKLDKGNVVVFSEGNRDLIKRIRTVTGKDAYVAAGDNTSHSRSYTITRRQVKGKLLMKC